MARIVIAGRLAFAQLDFFYSSSRKTGVIWSDLQLSTFVDSYMLPWPISDGVGISDQTIGAGAIFFNEVVGASGYYLVRFFVDRVGFWRLVFKHPTLGTEQILEFDSVPADSQMSGLVARTVP
jgi:hypothetical protein